MARNRIVASSSRVTSRHGNRGSGDQPILHTAKLLKLFVDLLKCQECFAVLCLQLLLLLLLVVVVVLLLLLLEVEGSHRQLLLLLVLLQVSVLCSIIILSHVCGVAEALPIAVSAVTATNDGRRLLLLRLHILLLLLPLQQHLPVVWAR
jgi:hypothetical protein